MKVLILTGSNHRFDTSAEVIHGFLNAQDDLDAVLEDDKAILASHEMAMFDALVLGTGFTRAERQADGSTKHVPDLTVEQEDGVFNFVLNGKGLVGVHGTGWWIGGRAVDLIGGHANWHPSKSTFTVHIVDSAHPIMWGIDDFEVDDEIYISAWAPNLHILATATWGGKRHPMAWVKPYGDGCVFYTTLGHRADTFERPAMQKIMTQSMWWVGGLWKQG